MGSVYLAVRADGQFQRRAAVKGDLRGGVGKVSADARPQQHGQGSPLAEGLVRRH
jgi:hypothetical protein